MSKEQKLKVLMKRVLEAQKSADEAFENGDFALSEFFEVRAEVALAEYDKELEKEDSNVLA